MRPSAFVDGLLVWLKWPVAIASFILLPGLAYALYRVAHSIVLHPAPSYAFLAGALAFALLWHFLLRDTSLGRYFMVLEHELTHALFAWATFHRVVAFRATVRSGGHVQILGRGNWLITVAPYFVPTASLLAIVALGWLPSRYLLYGNVGLGATIAYHVVSTVSETHRHQPDLARAGWLFSGLFLPSANLISLGIVVSYAAGLHPLAHMTEVPAMTRLVWDSVLASIR